MSMLRKEWTDEDMRKLSFDMMVAKIKVFNNWGFSVVEISRITDLPEDVIQSILNK